LKPTQLRAFCEHVADTTQTYGLKRPELYALRAHKIAELENADIAWNMLRAGVSPQGLSFSAYLSEQMGHDGPKFTQGWILGIAKECARQGHFREAEIIALSSQKPPSDSDVVPHPFEEEAMWKTQAPIFYELAIGMAREGLLNSSLQRIRKLPPAKERLISPFMASEMGNRMVARCFTSDRLFGYRPEALRVYAKAVTLAGREDDDIADLLDEFTIPEDRAGIVLGYLEGLAEVEAR